MAEPLEGNATEAEPSPEDKQISETLYGCEKTFLRQILFHRGKNKYHPTMQVLLSENPFTSSDPARPADASLRTGGNTAGFTLGENRVTVAYGNDVHGRGQKLTKDTSIWKVYVDEKSGPNGEFRGRAKKHFTVHAGERTDAGITRTLKVTTFDHTSGKAVKEEHKGTFIEAEEIRGILEKCLEEAEANQYEEDTEGQEEAV